MKPVIAMAGSSSACRKYPTPYCKLIPFASLHSPDLFLKYHCWYWLSL